MLLHMRAARVSRPLSQCSQPSHSPCSHLPHSQSSPSPRRPFLTGFLEETSARGTAVSPVVTVLPYSWSAQSQSLEPILRARVPASSVKSRALGGHSGISHNSIL